MSAKNSDPHFSVCFKKINGQWQFFGSKANWYTVTETQFNILYGDSIKAMNLENWEEARLWLVYSEGYDFPFDGMGEDFESGRMVV